MQQEEHEQGERKPVSALRCPESAEEQGRWSKDQQKDKRRHYLHHELILNDSHRTVTVTRLVSSKQPPANKEEARQPEQEEYIIESHPLVAKTVITDMRIHHEDHRKSPHGIDILDSSFIQAAVSTLHLACKITKNQAYFLDILIKSYTFAE